MSEEVVSSSVRVIILSKMQITQSMYAERIRSGIDMKRSKNKLKKVLDESKKRDIMSMCVLKGT